MTLIPYNAYLEALVRAKCDSHGITDPGARNTISGIVLEIHAGLVSYNESLHKQLQEVWSLVPTPPIVVSEEKK